MTDQEKQKLNKKLAEWAGFKTGKEPNVSGYYLFCGYEDKTICCSANFTDSLDACFEWLVPKLYPDKLDKIGLLVLVNNAICDSIEGKSTVSLALCLAIEKLELSKKDSW